MEQARDFNAKQRKDAAGAGDAMPDGSFPIKNQSDLMNAWKLRGHSKHPRSTVEAHIHRVAKKKGLKVPDDRQSAANTMQPHGFVWPTGLPACTMCGKDANDPIHVTPFGGSMDLFGAYPGGYPAMAKKTSPKTHEPIRSHTYQMSTPSLLNKVTCTACGQPLSDGVHPAGMPAATGDPTGTRAYAYEDRVLPILNNGTAYSNALPSIRHKFEALPGQERIAPDYQMCAKCGFTQDDEVHDYRESDETGGGDTEPTQVKSRPLPDGHNTVPRTGSPVAKQMAKQQAFIAEIGHRLIVAAPVTTDFGADSLPREVAADWQRASAANPNNLWIAGRYVEADRPNRNAAYWSTEDLQLGEPSVAHGPINWLHEERHIVGAIASSKMVHVDRQAAAGLDGGVGNHIVVLGAIWPYIYPQEAGLIQRASEGGKLWASMECVSKEVACLTCDRALPYKDYMRQEARCEHMRDGAPRRFKDPTFGGAGIIVPPVRPGWANADIRVLMPEAAKVAERQAAAFEGLSTSEAELLVAQLMR